MSAAIDAGTTLTGGPPGKPSYTLNIPGRIRHLLSDPECQHHFSTRSTSLPSSHPHLEATCASAGMRLQELSEHSPSAPVWSRPWHHGIVLSLYPCLMQPRNASPTPATRQTVVLSSYSISKTPSLNIDSPSLGHALPFSSTSLFCRTYSTCPTSELARRYTRCLALHQTFHLRIHAIERNAFA